MGNCFGKKTDIHLEKQYLINMDPELQLATFKNTPKFLPNIPVSKVIKVYDGDTITIAGKLDNQEEIYKWNIRLNNIDTPELKGKNINENEKQLLIQIPHEPTKIVVILKYFFDTYQELYGLFEGGIGFMANDLKCISEIIENVETILTSLEKKGLVKITN